MYLFVKNQSVLPIHRTDRTCDEKNYSEIEMSHMTICEKIRNAKVVFLFGKKQLIGNDKQ